MNLKLLSGRIGLAQPCKNAPGILYLFTFLPPHHYMRRYVMTNDILRWMHYGSLSKAADSRDVPIRLFSRDQRPSSL